MTGSTGYLGSALLWHLKDTEYKVKITSRRRPQDWHQLDWVYSDLVSGEGLEEAVKDVNVIIHAATSPMKNAKKVEIDGLENLLSKSKHIQHFIYPSIVGIEEIPWKYYQLKVEAEELLSKGTVPYTIARATQFHGFVENLLLSKSLFNRYVIPRKWKMQSVDVHEFATHLIDLVHKDPQGRVEDYGGPEIMTLREMAELKIDTKKEKKIVFDVSLPGKLSKAFEGGKNTNLHNQKGKITFEQFLRNK
ncbi:NmrA family NAD(P)-binding protein [Niallia taxi]|uniref:SDR family oxidoreductase n=1 Tax=Niallia taxi TaxID=2499688 RepID=UPI003981AD50